VWGKGPGVGLLTLAYIKGRRPKAFEGYGLGQRPLLLTYNDVGTAGGDW
jgi:hypothetical protein